MPGSALVSVFCSVATRSPNPRPWPSGWPRPTNSGPTRNRPPWRPTASLMGFCAVPPRPSSRPPPLTPTACAGARRRTSRPRISSPSATRWRRPSSRRPKRGANWPPCARRSPRRSRANSDLLSPRVRVLCALSVQPRHFRYLTHGVRQARHEHGLSDRQISGRESGRVFRSRSHEPDNLTTFVS